MVIVIKMIITTLRDHVWGKVAIPRPYQKNAGVGIFVAEEY
jgi:hypothetical protein